MNHRAVIQWCQFMQILSVLAVLWFVVVPLQGQIRFLDSLHTALRSHTTQQRNDSITRSLLIELARKYLPFDPLQAQNYAQNALTMVNAPEPGSPQSFQALQISALTTLSVAFFAQGKTDKADSVAHQALEKSKALAEAPARAFEHQSLFAQLYNVLGAIAVDQSKRSESLNFYAKALDYAERANDTTNIVQALCGLATNQAMLARYAETTKGLHRAFESARSSRQPPLLAMVLATQARYYMRLSAYNRALEEALQALKIYEQVGWNVSIADVLALIVRIYSFQFENTPQSFEAYRVYLQRARGLYERLGNKKGLMSVYLEIGSGFDNMKLYDSSLVYHRTMLAFAQELRTPYDLVTGYTNVGIMLWRTGKPDDGLTSLRQSLSLAEQHQFVRLMIVPLVRIASILSQSKHEHLKALPFVLRAVRIADSLGNRSRKQYALAELAAIYDSLGRHKEAFHTLQEVLVLRDSVFSKEAAEKTVQLQIQYETERKDNEILLLQKDKELQTLALSQQRTVQYLLGALLLAVSGAALWLGHLYRQKKQANGEILRQQAVLEEQTYEIELTSTRVQEQNELLVTLNSEKNEFLGIVAHDLKNPLTGIHGMADMLLMFEEDMTIEQRRQFLSTIINSSERMFDLIKNLLDINSLESGGRMLQMITLNACSQVRHIVDQYRFRAEQKRITFHYTDEGEAFVMADEQALVQVLENLISNAVKYSPQGKNIWVSVLKKQTTSNSRYASALKPASCCLILVTDEGPGISAEDMPKLFGKFARLSAQPTGGEHSTGLGLSIVKKLVEAMNGYVWCESEIGAGATFMMELPCVKT